MKPKGIHSKIVDRSMAGHELQTSGGTMVFTNGCFDILHRGHVTYLEQTARLADILVVGVNTDESVARLKGPDRPINTVSDRMMVLAALEAVDYVIPFSDDTPVELVRILRPDVYAKGGDYRPEDLPEARIVASYGGRVVIVPFVHGSSTTTIIDKIQHTHAAA